MPPVVPHRKKYAAKEYFEFIKCEKETFADMNRSVEVCQTVVLNLLSGGFVDGDDKNFCTRLTYEIDEIFAISQEIAGMMDKEAYEVAVVGNEKAGKTTMICTFLRGLDVLPTGSERCTYALTFIKWCESEEEQLVEIEYLTKEEFADYKAEVEREFAANEMSTSLKEEMEELKKYEKEIEKHLNKSIFRESYKDHSALRTILDNAVSSKNIGHARSIKQVKILTKDLQVGNKDITLIDVPGFNAPLKSIKEQTKKIIERADAVIFAKNFSTPSLVDTEVEIIDRLNATKSTMSLNDKIIVALTQFDREPAKAKFEDTLEKCKNQWLVKQVANERIFPVCAILKMEYPEGSTEWQAAQAAKNVLKTTLRRSDNIEELKEAVVSYLLKSRHDFLRIKLESFKSRIKTLMQNVFDVGKKRFPNYQNPEQEKENEERNNDIILREWWVKEWNGITQKFREFLSKEIFITNDPDMIAKQNESFDELKKKYNHCIQKNLREKLLLSEDEMRQIYKNDIGPALIVAPTKAHGIIRNALMKRGCDELDGIAEDLSHIIENTLQKIIDWIFENMWNIQDIKNEFKLDDEKAQGKIRTSIDALIQHIGKPALQVFIRYPREDGRDRLIAKFEKEILVLDVFYMPATEESDNASTGNRLVNYLTSGSFQETQAAIKAANFTEIYEEIISDIEKFIDYMENSVYYASGIEAYFFNEIQKRIDKFLQTEQEKQLWQSYTMAQVKKGNVKCPTLPDLIEKSQRRMEILECLKDLNNILHDIKNPAITQD